MIFLLEMQLFRIHCFVLSSMAENLIAREVLKNLVGCGKLLPRETAEPPRFEPWSTLATALSPSDGATASVSRGGATAWLPCKGRIPPASHEDAVSLFSVVPSPATCGSARVRVSHTRGVEVSGVVVVVVVSMGVGIGVVGWGVSLRLRSSQAGVSP